jgi:hypothetical protein
VAAAVGRRPARESRKRRVRSPSVLALVLLLLGAFLMRASICRADPRQDYILHCRGCHGPQGAGLPGSVPDFRGQVGKFLQVPGGREYLIRVPGTSQSELSDARVARLLNWLVREFSAKALPAHFEPFTEDEVSRHRRPPLTDVAGVRQSLLSAIPPSPASASRAPK